MENPEIPGRIQMVHPGENFSEKKYYISRYYLFPIFTETTEMFCTIYQDY